MIEAPPCCPLCQSRWTALSSPHCCACPNSRTCNMVMIVEAGGGRFFLKRVLTDGTEIWWSGSDFAQVRFHNEGFVKLTFDPPFDVTTERIKLLNLFS